MNGERPSNGLIVLTCPYAAQHNGVGFHVWDWSPTPMHLFPLKNCIHSVTLLLLIMMMMISKWKNINTKIGCAVSHTTTSLCCSILHTSQAKTSEKEMGKYIECLDLIILAFLGILFISLSIAMSSVDTMATIKLLSDIYLS